MALKHNAYGFLELCNRAGVEVRCREGYVAQRGHTEHVLVLLFLGEVLQSVGSLLVALCMGTQGGIRVNILKALSTQCGTGVAGITAVLLECLHAGNLCLCQGFLITHTVKIERRVGCYQSTLKGGNGIGNGFCGYAFAAIYLVKENAETLICSQFIGNVVPILGLAVAHFHGVEGRAAGLFLQIFGAAIPELAYVRLGIENGGGVHASQLRFAICPRHTLRLSKVVCAAFC